MSPFFARPYFRRRDGRHLNPHAGSYSYTPLQVKQAYGIPSSLDGSGTTIGIIELGGAFSQADYDAFMKGLGIQTYQKPLVFGKQQDDPGGANVEVMLDACVIGAMAPQAKIRLYFMPNNDSGMADGIKRAVQDGCNAISISWGADENSWSAAGREATDAALQVAAQKNVAVYVAAGDNGSSDGDSGTNCDYPASSPYAVGCGGTNLVIQNGMIVKETVWNDGPSGGATGGGYSKIYSAPAFQSGLTNGKRGVPDVAGVADPNSGWVIRADGSNQVVGGTSAVAPMWAAIHALLLQNNGGKSFAFPLPLFYANPHCFRDITAGSNGAYSASTGWDACTGLGSPFGSKLFALNLGGQPTPVPPSPPTPPPPPPLPQPPACFGRLEKQMNLPAGTLLQLLREAIFIFQVLLSGKAD